MRLSSYQLDPLEMVQILVQNSHSDHRGLGAEATGGEGIEAALYRGGVAKSLDKVSPFRATCTRFQLKSDFNRCMMTVHYGSLWFLKQRKTHVFQFRRC